MGAIRLFITTCDDRRNVAFHAGKPGRTAITGDIVTTKNDKPALAKILLSCLTPGHEKSSDAGSLKICIAQSKRTVSV
jgi:hypothetical protein